MFYSINYWRKKKTKQKTVDTEYLAQNTRPLGQYTIRQWFTNTKMMLKRDTLMYSLVQCALILNLAELLLFYLQQGGNRYFLMDQFMKKWNRIESNFSPPRHKTYEMLPSQLSFYRSFSVRWWCHRCQLMDADAGDPILLFRPSPQTNSNHRSEQLIFFMVWKNSKLFISVKWRRFVYENCLPLDRLLYNRNSIWLIE